jgi:hypothetical protein
MEMILVALSPATWCTFFPSVVFDCLVATQREQPCQTLVQSMNGRWLPNGWFVWQRTFPELHHTGPKLSMYRVPGLTSTWCYTSGRDSGLIHSLNIIWLILISEESPLFPLFWCTSTCTCQILRDPLIGRLTQVRNARHRRCTRNVGISVAPVLVHDIIPANSGLDELRLFQDTKWKCVVRLLKSGVFGENSEKYSRHP